MNRLEDLIHEFCPNGVKYKTLGEIATDIFRGAGITRDQVCEIGTPCVRYGEIYTTYGIWFDECVSHTDEALLTSKKYFEHGDILFAITGESVADIAKSCAYVGDEKCLAGGDIVVLKHNEDPKYLAYALSTTEAQMQKSKGKVKSKVVHSSVPAIQAIRIPVPPLEVQREIVRILDNFTELTAELTAELMAELTARKKQYEYYRDMLMSFDNFGERSNDNIIMHRTIGDIATVTKLAGFEFTNYVQYTDKGKIIALRGLNIKNGKLDLSDVKYIDNSDLSKLSRSKLTAGDMLFTYVGTIGQVALIDENEKYYLAPNVALIRITTNDLLPKYMRYYFQSSMFWKTQINRLLQSSSMQNIPMEKIRKFVISIPPLEEQRRIVSILDRFDTLCTDLTSGLPAEIAARQKQYEYYRDKLLTFKPLT